ncbi:MAG: diguanylate cyclase [Pseudodesulfovibrio sp.]
MSDSTLKQKLETAQLRIAELEAKLALQGADTPSTLQELAFEYAPGGMAVVSLNGDVLVCNQEGAEMLGYSTEDIERLDTSSLYTNPEDRGRLKQTLSNGQSVFDKEVQVNCKNGSHIWLNLNARPIEFGGRVSALLAFVDISSLKEAQGDLKKAHGELEDKVKVRTINLEEANEELAILNIKLIKKDRERDQAQQALKESEERFRSIFENKHVVMLLTHPASGKIWDANPAAVVYYGYSSATLKTMNIMDINTLTANEVRAEMRMAEKQDRNHFNFRHQLADGVVRDVEVFSGPVVVNKQQLLYSIVHDITARKETESTLHLYERIISSTPDFVSLVDKDYTYRMVNDAYLLFFGKERGDIVDKSVPDLVGQEYFEAKSKPNLDRALAGETVKVETTLPNTNKIDVHMSVTYHPVKGDGGAIDYVAVDARDVTELKEKEEALKEFSDRLELATDAGKIGTWEMDVASGTFIWDHMMMELYRLKPAEFSATYEGWRSRVHPDDIVGVEQALEDAMTQNKPFESEFRIVWPDGAIRHIKAAALIDFSKGKAIRMTGVNWDVTKKRLLEENLRNLATTDPLTGASNRRHFMTRGAEEFTRSKRYGTPTTMITLDIDHFKKINDTYGHPVGDEVLKALVAICKETLRTTDIFARMGGEEFTAILPETDLADGIKTAERLRVAVEESRVAVDDGTIQYAVSLGVSQLHNDDVSMEDLMRRADSALYLAKDSGRNRVESK